MRLALLALTLLFAAPALAQTADADAEARRTALDQDLRVIEHQARRGNHDFALARLELLVDDATAELRDRRARRRALRVANHLDIGSRHRGMIGGGGALMAAGAVTFLIGFLPHVVPFSGDGSMGQVDEGFTWVAGIGAGVLLTGLVVLIAGLIQHGNDPDRRAFGERRDRLTARLRAL